MSDLNDIKKIVGTDGATKAGALFGVDARTIYRWIKAGTGPGQARTRKALAAAKAKLAKSAP